MEPYQVMRAVRLQQKNVGVRPIEAVSGIGDGAADASRGGAFVDDRRGGDGDGSVAGGQAVRPGAGIGEPVGHVADVPGGMATQVVGHEGDRQRQWPHSP